MHLEQGCLHLEQGSYLTVPVPTQYLPSRTMRERHELVSSRGIKAQVEWGYRDNERQSGGAARLKGRSQLSFLRPRGCVRFFAQGP